MSIAAKKTPEKTPQLIVQLHKVNLAKTPLSALSKSFSEEKMVKSAAAQPRSKSKETKSRAEKKTVKK